MKKGSRGATIIRIFGANLPFNTIVNSILFTIIFFFFILTVGSYFKPLIYPLIDRVTYSTHFINKYVIGNYYDSLIILFGTFLWFLISIKDNKFKFILSFPYGLSILITIYKDIPDLFNILTLVSAPIILALVVINKIMENKILFFNKQICINYFSILGILLSIINVSLSLAHLFFPELSLPSINYMYYILLLFSTSTPILLIMISVPFPIKLLIIKIKEKTNVSKVKVGIEPKNSLNLKHLKLKTRLIIFFLIVIFSVTITIIPHIYTLNKDNQIIGDDSKDYVRMLDSVNKASNLQEFLNQVFIIQMSGDRPISLIFFSLWVHITDPSNMINSVEYLPLFLGPILILCVYFLTMELTANHFTSLLASFLTVTSFHILVGTYAGIYSNWFSLMFGYLAFLFLFRSFKRPNKFNIISFSILMIVTLLSHVPTWTILIMVIVTFLGLMLISKQCNKKLIGYLFLAIVPSLIIDGIRMIVVRSSGVVEDLSFAHSQGAGLHNLSIFWFNLVNTTQTYMAGLFGNSIILILVLYWLYKCNLKDKPTLFFIIFLSITILPLVFGEQQIQTRFLFEIPFQIPSAIALTYIRKYQGSLFFSVICLWLIVISIRASSNFYLVQH